MKDLVKFPLELGGFVFVEADITAADRGGLAKAGRGIPEDAAQSFEESINNLSPIASSIVSKLINISHSPDEAAVEFGLTLKAESGLVITRVAGNANFKMNLKWMRNQEH